MRTRTPHGPAIRYSAQSGRGDPWEGCSVCGEHVQSDMTTCGACGKKVCPKHRMNSLWSSQYICSSCWCGEVLLALNGDDAALSALQNWFIRLQRKLARKKKPVDTGILKRVF